MEIERRAPVRATLPVLAALIAAGCNDGDNASNSDPEPADSGPTSEEAGPTNEESETTGSGGDGTTSSGSKEFTRTPTAIKTFRFDWTAGTSADSYRLSEDRDGRSGYTAIATAPGDTTTRDWRAPALPTRTGARYLLEACEEDTGGEQCTTVAEIAPGADGLGGAAGYFKASNTDGNDLFGNRVALSDDGRTLAVAARDEDSAATGVNGDQTSQSEANAGAVYLFHRPSGGDWRQEAYIKASNTEVSDDFGSSLALSADGSRLAVGARDEDSAATGIDGDQEADGRPDSTENGAVYLFIRGSSGQWQQEAYVKAANAGSHDNFGRSVALADDGRTLAVGAPGEDSPATGVGGTQGDDLDNHRRSGAAYLFQRDAEGWSQTAYLKASNTGHDDEFGRGIALSGDGETVAVGAPQEDSNATGIDGDETNNGLDDPGAAYVFARRNGTWQQQAYVKAANLAAPVGFFGRDLALSRDGNTLAVGSFQAREGRAGVGVGAAYLYTRDAGDTWTHAHTAWAPRSAETLDFGWALDLARNGAVLAVGAFGQDSPATGIDSDREGDGGAPLSGAVYQFRRDGDAWQRTAFIKATNTGTKDRFGRSLELADDTTALAVGAPREDSSATGIGGDQQDDGAERSGAAYLY